MNMGPQWAKVMSKSLKALQKLNSALGSTHNSTRITGTGGLAGITPAGGIGGFVGAGALGRDGLVMPVTPESSSSGEWNYGNMFDRAAEYIQAPLWG